MTAAASERIRKHIWLSNFGLIIMAVAFAWWFLFYAQWTGPLRLLDLKVPCLVTTIDEYAANPHPDPVRVAAE